jgi:hypothetical protein
MPMPNSALGSPSLLFSHLQKGMDEDM